MKSFLYFEIKLEKKLLLYELKSYPETSKEQPKIKITQNNNKKIKQNSKNKEKKMLTEI